ncbi:copper-translocating P-type ATPase [Photobacterium aphoticum]|uniref:Copper-translocating P-type ATPase n=1 Tax=Photobacterium aphoticum TaxID=754436 RepID=A0A090QT07_9GAMM|nr:copper-translocating P-type ATPase [Photobacterium aphoticum]
MDCPSCARKLEKAVASLEGVVSAKVMFATEKLVVHCQSASLSDAIVRKTQQTGFRLITTEQNSDDVTPSFWQANLPVIVIAAMMAIASVLNRYSPEWGLMAFTATTLFGLVPIVRKAIASAKTARHFPLKL